MNVLSAVVQQGGEAAAQPNIFNIAFGVSFWTIVIFLLLLAVLYKYAYPHILGAVEAREQRIQEALDEAQRLREEAARLAEEERRRLEAAREEAQQIVLRARDAGERVQKEIEARARREGQEMIERARREILREKEEALDALRREAVELALAAAGKLLRRRLDAEGDRELVARFLDEAVRAREGGAEA